MSSAAALRSISLHHRGSFSKFQDEGKAPRFKKMSVACSSMPQKSGKDIRIGILGASGYTGAELVRLLANHPYFGISLMTADRKAGQSMGSVFPHLMTQDLPDMVAVKDADFSSVDAVFCCLPHGTTQEIIKGLPNNLKIVDLSADFRLRDIGEYEEWYGQPHKAPELQVDTIHEFILAPDMVLYIIKCESIWTSKGIHNAQTEQES